MINEKQLKHLGLSPYEDGYYKINEELIIDSKGNVKLNAYYSDYIFDVCRLTSLKEVKEFIKWVNK